MSLTLFDPDMLFETERFSSDLERAMDRAFNNALTSRAVAPTSGLLAPFVHGRGTHPMDIVETDKAYELHTDAPGMTPEDIKVEIHNGVLTVSGEHKSESKTKDEKGKVWRQERTFSKFSRQFTLPQNANEDQITATLDKGVLKVAVAKMPEPEKPAPKRISVNQAS